VTGTGQTRRWWRLVRCMRGPCVSDLDWTGTDGGVRCVFLYHLPTTVAMVEPHSAAAPTISAFTGIQLAGIKQGPQLCPPAPGDCLVARAPRHTYDRDQHASVDKCGQYHGDCASEGLTHGQLGTQLQQHQQQHTDGLMHYVPTAD
jgi:hypothetical protein